MGNTITLIIIGRKEPYFFVNILTTILVALETRIQLTNDFLKLTRVTITKIWQFVFSTSVSEVSFWKMIFELLYFSL